MFEHIEKGEGGHMKKLHVQIFLLVVGFGYGVSVDCMFATLGRRMRSVGRIGSRYMTAPIGGDQKPEVPVAKSIDTSTWSGWLKSWFKRSQPQQAQAMISSIGSQAKVSSPLDQQRKYNVIRSLQEPIAVSVLPDNKTIAQRESEDILRKLKENPLSSRKYWDQEKDPLVKQIYTFLKENESDVIEPVIIELIGREFPDSSEGLRGQRVLVEMVQKNHSALAYKLLPILDKNADNLWYSSLYAILRRLPLDDLFANKNLIERFFQSPTSILVLHEYKEISRFFPNDVSQFIRIIKRMGGTFKFSIDDVKSQYDQFISNLANTIVERLDKNELAELMETLLVYEEFPRYVGADILAKLKDLEAKNTQERIASES